MKKNIFIIFCLILSGVIGFLVSLNHYYPKTDNTIQTIQTFHYPYSFVANLANDPSAPKKIFKQFCSSCHGANPIIDLNAPRINDPTAWRLRKKLGIPLLLKMTTRGIGMMPARGGCFECSDQQLQATIQYILNYSNSLNNDS